jgi:phage terminase large subunit
MARQIGMPGPTKLLGEVEKMLAQHDQVKQVPLVLWAGLKETAESFAMRCASFQNRGVDKILAAVPFGYAIPPGVHGVPFAPKIFKLLHPSTPSRYRVASGGRGSGKSHGVATAVVLRMLSRRTRVLCAREMMNSISESVHHLLEAKIDALGLHQFFEITDRAITCVTNQSEAIFKGLFQNESGLKSLEEIDLCWIEQAEKVKKDSFEVLKPTIRNKGSEIWATLNPDDPEAPIQEYADGTRADTLREHLTWLDNPWWNSVLEFERLELQRVDADGYQHTYLGKCRFVSQACIFAGKYVIEAFEPDLTLNVDKDRLKDRYASVGNGMAIHAIEKRERESSWLGPYFGADFGFAVDPTAAVKVWIFKRDLYIEYECYKVGCDIDKTPELFDQIPGARKHVMRCDSAAPAIVSYLKQHGYPRAVGVKKGKGSVDEGIAFMRSFERIVVHPRCVETANEMRLYSWRVDRLTGDPMPEPADAFNHLIDACRYALEPAIRQQRKSRWIPMTYDVHGAIEQAISPD